MSTYEVSDWIENNPNEAQDIAEGVIDANAGDLATQLLDGIDDQGVRPYSPHASLSAQVYEACAERAGQEAGEEDYRHKTQAVLARV